ncbi:uncharacterized protein LY89DRAFT_664796 [Mollisia scopiformis]|uniref:DUF218 domain-containing protein n=1 Tax=Mollisia scopiformis TaxID=149040 RepID=A0A194XN97_MOLSC|nr:uncharacterized protein LY89DRAFT_664796 [Mollisia scopiformis]KUJ21616.1 hypothetical protein LY89DRAFT_664796 [Mollisia scopiformis]
MSTDKNSTESLASDVNFLSCLLTHPQISDLSSHPPVDCITLCVSSVLYQATTLFEILQSHPRLTKSLVLCGGIGHSTPLIYQAVSRHPKYRTITSEIQGLPEARVLERILNEFFDIEKITSQGCRILIEDQSTNCGANASKTRELLEKNGIETPKSMIVVQDPTMALRTVASFQKVYEGVEMDIRSAPIFVPVTRVGQEGQVEWDTSDVGITIEGLWEKERFYDLIMGEVPRLRDDTEGYGPKGKGFIVHVDIPGEVEDAWQRLVKTSNGQATLSPDLLSKRFVDMVATTSHYLPQSTTPLCPQHITHIIITWKYLFEYVVVKLPVYDP